MPEYNLAQHRLDSIAAGWQKDIDNKQAELDNMYKAYDAEQVMLSDELKKKEKTSFLIKKKNFVICNANALVLKAIYSKKTRTGKACAG
jgi:Skp family chaperone for outer membrane proteins